MILEREQIQRYLRHILIPEISGPGQLKLLNSSILIYCDNLIDSAQMLYYLTAMGIGQIHCQAKQTEGKETLLSRLNHLNPDVRVSINSGNAVAYNAVIACCDRDGAYPELEAYIDAPVILSAASGDRGFLKTVTARKQLSSALDEVGSFFMNSHRKDTLFNKACINLLGNLAATEAVKVLLPIGTACENALQFDLLSYEFVYGINLSKAKVYELEMRQISKKLQSSKALIIGSGGLGSPAAYMLTAMGIGTIGLVDYDTVELSNLNRQILHSTDKIGMPKVKSAKEFLQALNPDLKILAYEERFTKSNAAELVSDYDVIIDALDNLETRYLLNDICYRMDKTLIEAGVLGFNGLAANITASKGPCYRCIFPEEKGKNPVPS